MIKSVLIGLFVIFLAAGCLAPAVTPASEPSPLALGSAETPAAAGAQGTAVLAQGSSSGSTPTAVSDAATATAPTRAPAAPASPTPIATPEAATAAPVSTAVETATAVATPTEAASVPSTACTPGALTPAQTEGPYYSASPPEDADLYEEGMGGTRVVVTGYVFDQDCKPIPGARVDFWQADAAGVYDNQGYRLRGYQVTDAMGRYAVTTVIPGEYPGRPPHIHVKVTPPGGGTLTSQLYFPGVAGNTADRIFDAELVVTMEEGSDGQIAFFNFVVPAGN